MKAYIFVILQLVKHIVFLKFTLTIEESMYVKFEESSLFVKNVL